MLSFYKENMRWLAGGFLLTAFSAFGQTFFISIWGAEIRGAYGLTHGGFGAVYMIATLVSAVCLTFVGKLVDYASVAKTVLIVILMFSCACLLMAWSQSIVTLVAAIFLLRLFGQGMMSHTAITALGRWYAANRGKAVSFASIGHQATEGIFPSLFVAIALVVGWRQSWVVAAASLILIALPLTYWLMHVERIPRNVGADLHSSDERRQWTRVEMLRDPYFWMAGAGVFAPAFIGTSIWFHQDYLIELNGWPPELYYQSFALMAVTTTVCSLLAGLAIDRWSAIQLLPIFMVPLGLSCLVLGTIDHWSAILIFMVLLGISYGNSSAIFGAIWPEVYGTRYLGSIRALCTAFMVFMSAAGPGVTGALIDFGIPFSTQLLYISVYCFATIAILTVASRGMYARSTAK